jgi:orotate phosphoribosyltransferase
MNEKEVIYRLLKDHAYRFHSEGIKLASGKISQHYFNAKEVICRREGGLAFARWALSVLAEFEVIAIGGLEIGAVPPASMISVLSSEERPLNSFIVRKKPKDHGLPNAVEGVLPKGARVAIIEDVVTSGGSALQAIHAVEAAGATVAVVIALLDRQEDKKEEFQKYPLRSALTIAEFLAMRGDS